MVVARLEVQFCTLECFQFVLLNTLGLYHAIVGIENIQANACDMLWKYIVCDVTRVRERKRTSLTIVVILLDAAREQNERDER